MEELALVFALCTVLIIIVILILLQTRKARCPCGCIPSECNCPMNCPGCTCAAENFKSLKSVPTHRQTKAHVMRAKRRSEKFVGDPEVEEDNYYPSGELNYNHEMVDLPAMMRPEYHRYAETIGQGNKEGDLNRTQLPEMYGDEDYQNAEMQDAVMEGQPDGSLIDSAEPFHGRSRAWGPARYHRLRRGWRGGGYYRGFGYPPVVMPEIIDDDTIYSYVHSRGYVEHQRAYDPSPQDDIRSGHQRGHVWRNIRSQKMFVLVDDSPNYAKWMPVQDVAPMTDRVQTPRTLGQQKKLPRGGTRQYLTSEPSAYKEPSLTEKTNDAKGSVDPATKQPAPIMNLVQTA